MPHISMSLTQEHDTDCRILQGQNLQLTALDGPQPHVSVPNTHFMPFQSIWFAPLEACVHRCELTEEDIIHIASATAEHLQQYFSQAS